jgi:queuine tRNA-ribosyltransferase
VTRFAFAFHATDGLACMGEIVKQRGSIRTPAVTSVGTAATVKGLRAHQVRAAGASIILRNTYCLMLRPGAVAQQLRGPL